MLMDYGALRSPLRRRYLCDISGVDGPSRPKNISSIWHTKEDNEKLFTALGTDTFTIATGICVLKCSSKGENLYEEFRGIATFAKDFVHRCNYIRIYHITTFELLYEIELLDMFLLKVHRSDRRRLTINMGIHYADLSFAERADMLLFKKKLNRIGINKIPPSFKKRIQNYWDNAKKFLGGIIYENDSKSGSIRYSISEYSYEDDVGLVTPKETKLMYKRDKLDDFSNYCNNNEQRSGVKRKITLNEIEPVYYTAKRSTSEYETPSLNLKSSTYVTVPRYMEGTCIKSNMPLSPPDTPKGILIGPKRNSLQLNRKSECMDIEREVVKSEIRQVNSNINVDHYNSCHSEFTFPNPPVLKGAIRTVPRPRKDPPILPPILSTHIGCTPEQPRIIPSDLLAEIRSAPQLRHSMKKKNSNNEVSMFNNIQSHSPLHLIRSAMITRRKSMKQEDDSDDEVTRNTINDTTDWSTTERHYDIKKYNSKYYKY
uniref:IRS-type PTB domain-containing protein n=1 Tax=Parastrongyloides trichosuri TaxID=131310 RepID=A0A0N4ZVE2_PARTI